MLLLDTGGTAVDELAAVLLVAAAGGGMTAYAAGPSYDGCAVVLTDVRAPAAVIGATPNTVILFAVLLPLVIPNPGTRAITDDDDAGEGAEGDAAAEEGREEGGEGEAEEREGRPRLERELAAAVDPLRPLPRVAVRASEAVESSVESKSATEDGN